MAAPGSWPAMATMPGGAGIMSAIMRVPTVGSSQVQPPRSLIQIKLIWPPGRLSGEVYELILVIESGRQRRFRAVHQAKMPDGAEHAVLSLLGQTVEQIGPGLILLGQRERAIACSAYVVLR